MSSKIVPIYDRLQYQGPDKPGKVVRETSPVMYDAYVDGTFVGSRSRAEDAENLILQHNADIQAVGGHDRMRYGHD